MRATPPSSSRATIPRPLCVRVPMNVLFEDDGQLKAGTVLADHDASLQVEAASGQAPEDQGRQRAAALRRARRRRGARAGAASSRPSSTRRSCGKSRGDDEFGFDELAREYYGAQPTPRASSGGGACCCTASPMHFYKRGKGRYRKAPADALEGRAGVGRAQASARRCRSTRGSPTLAARRGCPTRSRPKLSMLLYKPDKNALEWKALAAACEAQQDQSGRAARRVRRDPVDARLPLRRASSPRRSRSGTAFPPLGPLPPLPELPLAERARVLDRRRVDHRDRRRVLGARARQRQLRDRHPHRGARRSRSPRGSAARRDRARAAVDRLHARPQDHDAARRGRRGVHARGRRARARRCRSTSRSTPDGRAGRATRRASSACRSPRTCASTRSATRSRNDLPSPSDPPWTRELRVLWKLAQHLVGRARQERHRAHRLQLRRRLGRARGDGEPGASRIVPRARGSRRSTSSSPS